MIHHIVFAAILAATVLCIYALYLVARHITEDAELEPSRSCNRCGWPHAVRNLTTGRIDCGACLFPWNPGEKVHPSALAHADELDPTPFVDAVETPTPFPTTCAHCGLAFAAGSVPHWTLGGGPYHAGCAFHVAGAPRGAA